jgi:hypothetical protein
MIKSNSDYSLYYIRRNGKLSILLLYVDDLLITGECEKEVAWLKTTLQQKFKMMDLG